MQDALECVLVNRHFLDLNPLVLGSEQCAKNKRFGPAVRKYTLIHYVASGSGFLEKGGKCYPVHEGEAFLILPDEITTYYANPDDPWHYQWIGFDGALSDRFATLPPVFAMSSNWIREMLDTAQSEMREYKICAGLFRMYAELFAAPKSKHQYIKQVQNYIHALYMQDLQVENIAQKMNLDRRYLSRVFKEKTGVTIKEYLIGVRMEEAKRRLETGESIAEAACLCGYDDVCNFSKMFKKRFGISPQQWQKKNRV